MELSVVPELREHDQERFGATSQNSDIFHAATSRVHRGSLSNAGRQSNMVMGVLERVFRT